jgi:hypothetical protein
MGVDAIGALVDLVARLQRDDAPCIGFADLGFGDGLVAAAPQRLGGEMPVSSALPMPSPVNA